MTSYVMYICISSSSIIRFQLPKLSRLQYHSPLTPDDSSKHSCWLWTHDVSWVMSVPYPYPIHFIVMYMYRPQSSHSAVWIYQSLILKIYVMWFAILNDARPYQSIGWIPSRNKYTTHILLCILDECTYTNRWIIWIVAIRSYYIFVLSILSYIIMWPSGRPASLHLAMSFSCMPLGLLALGQRW